MNMSLSFIYNYISIQCLQFIICSERINCNYFRIEIISTEELLKQIYCAYNHCSILIIIS